MDSASARRSLTPPGFLQLAGHPLRWRLLEELSRSDRQVQELTSLVGQPQNLVSYHLGRLRAGGLVSARRSSADGRDAYYTVDLAGVGEVLAGVGAALHPGLRLTSPALSLGGVRPASRRVRVLLLCTGNSARSQMAEALLQELGGDDVEAVSAGSHPKVLHPNAVRVMAERGIDIAERKTKHLNLFARRRFAAVITLCDKVREVCPEFPGHPNLIHWSVADPSTAGDTDADTYPAFQATAEELADRSRFLLHRLLAAPTSAAR